jgi:hypothetical protein
MISQWAWSRFMVRWRRNSPDVSWQSPLNPAVLQISLRDSDMTVEIVVNDKMQTGYRYVLSEQIGQNFHPDFKPELTPRQMLCLGVFGGKYMTDSANEFPADWFEKAKLSPEGHDPSLNYFGVSAGQPLSVWRAKSWIYPDDPRGWFQWYCRYYQGRRIDKEDDRQIKRWKAMRRHIRQIEKNCEPGNVHCRRRQRQALLQWAYDSRKI